jgi:hypothetical protein
MGLQGRLRPGDWIKVPKPGVVNRVAGGKITVYHTPALRQRCQGRPFRACKHRVQPAPPYLVLRRWPRHQVTADHLGQAKVDQPHVQLVVEHHVCQLQVTVHPAIVSLITSTQPTSEHDSRRTFVRMLIHTMPEGRRGWRLHVIIVRVINDPHARPVAGGSFTTYTRTGIGA